MRARIAIGLFGCLLAHAAFAFSFDLGGARVRGSGKVAHDSRSLPAFHAVSAGAGIHVDVAVGAQKPVEVTADDNVVPLVKTEVVDGELRVGFQENASISTSHEIEVRVVAPQLDALGASGGARVKGEVGRGGELSLEASGGGEVRLANLDKEAVDARGSGGATLELAGRAERLTVEVSGGSQLHAAKLDTVRVRVQGSGGCQGELHASESVKGGLSGGCSLRIFGKARARVATAGGSSIDYGDDE